MKKRLFRGPIEISQATLKDSPNILKINELNSLASHGKKLTKSEELFVAGNHYHFTVAKIQGKIVAVSSMNPERKVSYAGLDGNEHSATTNFIANTFTLPGYRHKGISTMILNSMVQKAVKEGKKELYVAAEGKGSPGFWEKMGFEKVGICKSCEKFQRGECTTVSMYRKRL